MLRRPFLSVLLALACLPASAQVPPVQEAMEAQRAALAPLAILDGMWRGPAQVLQPGGQWLTITQTERVGPMLGGALKVIEGRGYMPDGSLHFNAFAVISFEPRTRAFTFRSYALGREGSFPAEVRADGFTWSTPAGPGATIRYTATVKDGTWHEVGHRLVDGQPEQRIFEMKLRRVGGTDWPAQGAMQPG